MCAGNQSTNEEHGGVTGGRWSIGGARRHAAICRSRVNAGVGMLTWRRAVATGAFCSLLRRCTSARRTPAYLILALHHCPQYHIFALRTRAQHFVAIIVKW